MKLREEAQQVRQIWEAMAQWPDSRTLFDRRYRGLLDAVDAG
jgi:hypothetical protein